MIMRWIRDLKAKLERRRIMGDSTLFTQWLRQQGCRIGEGVQWYGLPHVYVDITRPSLIEIGNNVCFTRGCTLLTHGFDWFVLRNLYDEVIASSGRLRIGDNVFVGMGSVLLKGITIGDNCIIGALSLVNKDIPPNSVAAGNPAKVVCTIEQYYEKRKRLYAEEAKDYARSIKENLGRDPVPADFHEEFPLFLPPGEPLPGARKSIRYQLGASYDNYMRKHKPLYPSFEAFLKDAGL